MNGSFSTLSTSAGKRTAPCGKPRFGHNLCAKVLSRHAGEGGIIPLLGWARVRVG